MEIIQIKNTSEIATVAQLAQEIWRQHFPSIIGMDQVEYMLEKFQSVEAITSQVQSGHQYYLVKLDDDYIGYTCLLSDPGQKKMMLSKIYVKSSTRGKGVGRALLVFIEAECKSEGLDTLWLTVNRFNDPTVEWYKHHGFLTVDTMKKDIGNGYFMDDYIMEKQL